MFEREVEPMIFKSLDMIIAWKDITKQVDKADLANNMTKTELKYRMILIGMTDDQFTYDHATWEQKTI